MAIVNVTPDSFSGDGLGHDLAAAVRQAEEAIAAGADVIDIGGESTAYWKPGYEPVTIEEELARILPFIEQLREKVSVPISIDTRKPEVARQALAAGATWLNNVEGIWDDGAMAAIAAEFGVPMIIMHNHHGHDYDDLVKEVSTELSAAAARALAAGVPADHLILDPGLGFGKTPAHSYELLRRLPELVELGFPILVGPSRKRFLGYVLGTPENDRLEGTEAAVAIAISRGAAAIRVHDVAPVVRVVRVSDAIVYGPQ